MTVFFENNEDKFFSLSPLLQEVFIAISIASRPLHAREIVKILELRNGNEFWKKSKTPEKTINARVSEHILKSETQSVFFRTGPNLFYHRLLNESAVFDSQYEESWHLPRTKPLTDEFVLVAPKDQLEKRVFGDFVPLEQIDLHAVKSLSYFMPRSTAERDKSVKQFVSYSMVKSLDRYLVYRRGKWSNPSANLHRTWSIAFGGHVSDADLTLFDDFEDCFLNNSSREVREELKLFNLFDDLEGLNSKSSLKGFINVDDNSDAKQHVAAVVDVRLNLKEMPSKVENGINELQWLSLDELAYHRSQFDLWSKILISKVTEHVRPR